MKYRVKHRTLPEPTGVDPLIVKTVRLMNQHQAHVGINAEKTGVHRNTFRNWRTTNQAGISDLNAWLNGFGYKLEIVPLGKNE